MTVKSLRMLILFFPFCICEVQEEEVLERLAKLSDQRDSLKRSYSFLDEKIDPKLAYLAHFPLAFECERRLMVLKGIDTHRTAEKSSFDLLSKLFPEQEPQLTGTCGWAALQWAPIFTFFTQIPTSIINITFRPYQESTSNPRQLRFHFRLKGRTEFTSKVYDLPREAPDGWSVAFVSPIVLDELDFDVIQNWGYTKRTDLPLFEVYGPK